jgi:polyhydroxyalkanoate synthesis regulator phasin
MMNNSQPIVNISLLLGTIIAVSAFFLVSNNIPVQALHKEEQLLENFDDLADFAKAVRNGDADIEEIPIQSMKAANIYDDANDSLKDCIDQGAKIGDSLTDREVVHCVDDVNYFNNKYSNSTNSTVPTTATSTATSDTADTGTDTTSTSDTADTTSTSDTADTTSTSDTGTDTTSTSDTGTDTTSTSDTGTDTTSTSDTADTTSTSDNSIDNNLVDELVKTGKFTEAEAKEFVNNNMQSGTGTDTTSDTTSTSNADTNTDDTTSTSNADTNTDSSASDDTSSSNNENNNNQSSNNNSNNPEDYDDLDELVKDIKNRNVDTDEISLSAFQDSGAYQGANQETKDCIDLGGKIGHNLGDQEIVNCSEDPNFYRNEISNTNDNNADDSSNNADDSSNNADENSDSSNDNNN